jgi:hypothetical protein
LIRDTQKPKKKLLGIRNGLKIFSTLKTYSKLEATTALNPITDKQKKINATWKEITDQKSKDLDYICQWCGLPGKRDAGFNCLTGHHILKRRFGVHTYDNDFVCHLLCHSFIEDHSVDVTKIHNSEEYKMLKD